MHSCMAIGLLKKLVRKLKFPTTSETKHTYQNLWDTAKAALKRPFITSNAYLIKTDTA